MEGAEHRRIKRPLRENPYLVFEQWQFPEDPEFKVIGRYVEPKDGRKITGRELYMRDIKLPGMLYAGWLTSPYAHALVRSVDADAIRSMPGVRDVLTCKDPDLHVEGSPEGLAAAGELEPLNVKRPEIAFVLPCEAVFEGQPVGVAVAADNMRSLYDAIWAARSKVNWEELPFVVDRDEALRPDAPVAQLFRGQETNAVDPKSAGLLPFVPWVPSGTSRWEMGNPDEGFRQADGIVEFEVKANVNMWGGGGVEPWAAIAWLHDGHLELWIRNQVPRKTGLFEGLESPPPKGLTMEVAAAVAGVPLSRVKVHIPYFGTSYGGMNWNGYSVIPTLLAILFSRRTGRPVMVLADWSSWSGIIGEEEGRYRFKVGFKRDGTITAVEVRSNVTWGIAGLTMPGSWKIVESTSIKNFRVEGVYPYTNKPPAACYKHGTTECLVLNEVFSRVAAALGMDPTELALRNDGSMGLPMHPDLDEIKAAQGFPVRDSLREVVEAGKRAIDWDHKWHRPGAMRLPNGNYHGIGFAWCPEWQVAPWHSVSPDTAFQVGLFLNEDGTAVIRGLRALVGNHEPSTYAQIVAEESGLRYEDIEFDHEFQDAVLSPPSGSNGLVWNSALMKELGMRTRQKLLEVAGKHMGKEPGELDVKDGVIYEKANPGNSISVGSLVAKYREHFAGGIWATGRSALKGTLIPPSPMEAHSWGRQAAFVEVEVDPETGRIEVKNVVIVNDVGRVVNPGSVAGQQYGGVYMGISRALGEEIIYDPNTGVKLNDTLAWYYVPTIADVYPVHAIAVETGLGYGAYGIMGVGEDPAALTRAALRSAVHNAIGRWVNEDPMTPDRVLRALGRA